jgi:hypothetical protein
VAILSELQKLINKVLASIDVALTRRTTLDRTRSELNNVRVALEAERAEVQILKAALVSQHSITSLADETVLRIAEKSRADMRNLRRDLIRHQIADRWSVVDAVERATAGPNAAKWNCPLCQHTSECSEFRAYSSNCIFGGGILQRHQCPQCDVIFGPVKMLSLSPKELAQEYEWHYQVYEEGDSTDAEVRAFKSLNPRRDGVYLNFGAGAWSRSVQVLRQEGWNVLAYEPHSSASTTEDWVIAGEAALHDRRFDGLFSNNVLEHFRYPVEELRRMKQWLKPGALMAHATPCYEYLYEYTRFHLFFFPGRSRELLAQQAGLSINGFEVDGHYMNCVFKSNEDDRTETAACPRI